MDCARKAILACQIALDYMFAITIAVNNSLTHRRRDRCARRSRGVRQPNSRLVPALLPGKRPETVRRARKRSAIDAVVAEFEKSSAAELTNRCAKSSAAELYVVLQMLAFWL